MTVRTHQVACVLCLSFLLLTVPGRVAGAPVDDNSGSAVSRADVVKRHRAAEFARLHRLAQQQGTVPVIIEIDVPNVKTLTRAAVSARGHRMGDRADARLEAAITPVAQAEMARLIGVNHTVGRVYKTVPFVALRVSEQALTRLAASPGVVDINEDRITHTMLDNTPIFTGATASWAQGFDGTGWYVAVLDTGLRNTHEFFAGKDIVEACFTQSGNPVEGDCPNGLSTQFGPGSAAHHATPPSSVHGTHVAGIACGNGPGGPGKPDAGIAKGADLIAIQVFTQGADDVGSFPSDQIAGLEFVFLLRNTLNISSINMSLGGGPVSNQADCDSNNAGTKAAIDNLRGAGIASAIATGNNGSCNGVSGPGCISTAIGVGATNDLDSEASFSNYHFALFELYAPGVEVLSSVGGADDAYQSVGWSGTSMATPHVCGTWAILKQAYPEASVSSILDVLQATGKPVSGRCVVGPQQPRIQIDAALTALRPVAACEITKLTASTPGATDEFAHALAVSGDVVVSGAHLDSDQGAGAGSVYIYRRTGTSWGGEQEVFASDAAAGDEFGSAVAIEGDVIAVGARFSNGTAGAVYVFRWNGTSWVEEQKLVAADGAAADLFGESVALSGNVIAVGAIGDDDVFDGSGSVYVFRFDGSTWNQELKITAFDAFQSDNFGSAVALAGDWLFASSPNDDDGGSGSGSVYTYLWTGTSWLQFLKITASDAAAGDRFGQSLAAEGNRLVVGANRDDTAGLNAGSAYYFEWDGVIWGERQELVALDASDNARFGQAVSLHGDYIVIGAYFDSEVALRGGAAYIFRRRPTEWLQDSKFIASDVAANDRLGYAVAAGDGYAFLGARKDDGGVGIDEGSLHVLAALADCNGNSVADACDILADASIDADNDGVIDSCACPPSSAPIPAVLAANGSTGISADVKNRFLSITAGDPGMSQMIRVTFGPNLPPPYNAWDDLAFFAGAPFQVCENSGNGLETAPPNCGPALGLSQKWFWASRLVCDVAGAHAMDWTTLADYCTGSGEPCSVDGDCAAGTCGTDGVVHLLHPGIVPSKKTLGQPTLQIPADYRIQTIAQECDSTTEENYSATLVMTQPAFGDVVETVGTCPNGVPNLNIDVLGDVVAAINKFSNLDCAPKKTRIDIAPGTVDFKIDFGGDVLGILGAFSGAGYSVALPADPCVFGRTP